MGCFLASCFHFSPSPFRQDSERCFVYTEVEFTKGEWKMFRRMICMLSVMGVVILIGIPVLASENTGSVCIIPEWRENREVQAQIALYRIGALSENSCRITDGLADWIISRQETQTDDFLRWATSQSWKDKQICTVSAGQRVEFENLEEGLYLVTASEIAAGYPAFSPFLVPLHGENNMHVVISPGIGNYSEIPRTGDYPAPIFMAMLLSFGIIFFMVFAENRKK